MRANNPDHGTRARSPRPQLGKDKHDQRRNDVFAHPRGKGQTMNRKMQFWYAELYLKSLAYAVVYGCDLSVEQFAAAHCLEADELEELRELLERQGVGI